MLVPEIDLFGQKIKGIKMLHRLTAIVAMDKNGVIGASNTLPWKVKSDLKFFKETTSKNVVMMGRKTFDSLGGKCLPNRRNLILTHSLSLLPFKDSNCATVNSIDEALYKAGTQPKKFKDVFVIGGASIYEQFEPFVDRYFITVIDKKVNNGDAFFDKSPLFDENLWERNCKQQGCKNDIGDEADFIIYEFNSKKPDLFSSKRDEAIARYKDQLNRVTSNRPAKNKKLYRDIDPNWKQAAFI